MTLSVLQYGSSYNNYGLYDSKLNKFIVTGTQEEMFEIKHLLEDAEQKRANKLYFADLRKRLLCMITSGGVNISDAEQFLKSCMPFLYDENNLD